MSSPIYSLLDPVRLTALEVLQFEDLGAAHDGQHVALYFRRIVDTQVTIDVKNPFELNRFCRLYNLVNSRGSIYGLLFHVLRPEFLVVEPHRFWFRGKESVDFDIVPITNSDVIILRSSGQDVLAITRPTGNLVVEDTL